MQKLGGWRVQICGCAGRGLEVVPLLLLAFIDVTLLDYRFFVLRFLVYIVLWAF